ncbi:MAG: CHAD domain-containing protein [Nitrososphaeraceae archaeon]
MPKNKQLLLSSQSKSSRSSSARIDNTINKVNKNFSRIHNILSLYLKNPNEKNIHDVRKSIRRADSAYMILSKKYRKKKSFIKYINTSKKFFKVNSKIRDYDIYLEKIQKHTSIVNSNNNIKPIILKYRNSELENAVVVAKKLKQLKCPQIQIKKDNKKLNKQIDNQFKKMSNKFEQIIEDNMPLVITDDKRIKELHEVRKDCKKLRYILELKLNDNEKNEELSELINNLENIQDSLGKIHDCDATISFFKKLKPQTKVHEQIIYNETQNRITLYERFVHKYNTTIKKNLPFVS